MKIERAEEQTELEEEEEEEEEKREEEERAEPDRKLGTQEADRDQLIGAHALIRVRDEAAADERLVEIGTDEIQACRSDYRIDAAAIRVGDVARSLGS